MFTREPTQERNHTRVISFTKDSFMTLHCMVLRRSTGKTKRTVVKIVENASAARETSVLPKNLLRN